MNEGFEGLDIFQTIQKPRPPAYEQIKTYYHYNRHGDLIDVRTISPRYAKNLYRWYRRNYRWLFYPLAYRSTMMKELRRVKRRRWFFWLR